MSQGYTIHVTGLSPETTEAKLNDFFSFCGKLQSVTKTDKSATLVFEKESAMRTSLMLNGGTLDGAHLEVSSAQAAATPATGALPSGATPGTAIGAGGVGSGPVGHGLEQEDKPVAGIVAEYLAHGYVLSDHIVQRAIEMDHKQGISSRFLTYISSLDHQVGQRVVGPDQTVSGKVNAHLQTAVQKTKEVDQSRGISSKATDYYAKALNTPIGQKVLSFYTTTSKQVIDVHEEAKRIAAEKKLAAGGTAPAAQDTLHTASEKASAALPTASTTGVTGTAAPAASAPAPAAAGPVV